MCFTCGTVPRFPCRRSGPNCTGKREVNAQGLDYLPARSTEGSHARDSGSEHLGAARTEPTAHVYPELAGTSGSSPGDGAPSSAHVCSQTEKVGLQFGCGRKRFHFGARRDLREHPDTRPSFNRGGRPWPLGMRHVGWLS